MSKVLKVRGKLAGQMAAENDNKMKNLVKNKQVTEGSGQKAFKIK